MSSIVSVINIVIFDMVMFLGSVSMLVSSDSISVVYYVVFSWCSSLCVINSMMRFVMLLIMCEVFIMNSGMCMCRRFLVLFVVGVMFEMSSIMFVIIVSVVNSFGDSLIVVWLNGVLVLECNLNMLSMVVVMISGSRK